MPLKKRYADKLKALGFKEEDFDDIGSAFEDDDDAGGDPPARGRSNGGTAGSGRVVVIEGDEARSFLKTLGFGGDDGGDDDAGDDDKDEPAADDKPTRTGSRYFD